MRRKTQSKLVGFLAAAGILKSGRKPDIMIYIKDKKPFLIETPMGGSNGTEQGRQALDQIIPDRDGAPAPVAKDPAEASLIDPLGRRISYIRVSVTDRCDFRCFYCMGEDMEFLRRKDLLSLEELDRLCSAFVRNGVSKIRLTGGEPLVRRGLMWLVRQLSRHLKTGALRELTLTTNGSQLVKFADELADCGVKRINISMDTLKEDLFREVTRGGDLARVLEGVKAAQNAGLKIKINTVALRGVNEFEIEQMMLWAHEQGMEMTLIETMPLGQIGGDRADNYLPLSDVRAALAEKYTLLGSDHCSGGPARFVTVEETGGRLGMITPLSHTFCESCNRVRLTSTGTLFMCLGQEDSADLRAVLRSGADDAGLDAALQEAITRKPKGHDFVIDRSNDQPALNRHMSVTGG